MPNQVVSQNDEEDKEEEDDEGYHAPDNGVIATPLWHHGTGIYPDGSKMRDSGAKAKFTLSSAKLLYCSLVLGFYTHVPEDLRLSLKML